MCYKIMSWSDLFKKLMVIAMESSRNNPPASKKKLCAFFQTKFSTFINVHKVAMKVSWPNVLFC